MKLKYEEIDISLYGNLSEMSMTYEFRGRYTPCDCYIHPIEQQWYELEGMGVISHIERDKVEVYELLTEAVNSDGSINTDVIPVIKERLNDLSELFGGESYNGWDYENRMEIFSLSSTEAAIIDTALFVVAKCYVFQNHTRLLTIG